MDYIDPGVVEVEEIVKNLIGTPIFGEYEPSPTPSGTPAENGRQDSP